MNGQPTKDVKPKAGKIGQAIALLCIIGCFLVTIYSLFEAYWTGEVLECGKGHGCQWVSYQNSPGTFVFVLILDTLLFLSFGYLIGRKMAGK